MNQYGVPVIRSSTRALKTCEKLSDRAILFTRERCPTYMLYDGIIIGFVEVNERNIEI